MTFEYSPYILPLIAAAFVSITVAIYTWRHRDISGAFALLLAAVSMFTWTFAYSLEIAGTNLETKYFWGVIQYFGIAFVPYGWFLFAASYSDLTKIIPRRVLAAAGFIPLITLLLAVTTKWHGLIWSEYHIQQAENFSAIQVSYGIWFWVHVIYSYMVLLAGTVLLSRTLWRRQGMYRGQMIAMLIAVLAPWIGNALYLTGNSPIPHLDLTPFAFTVSIMALAWAIFGFHLMDVAPLAREHVIDSLTDGMIVLNLRDRIVDMNSSAARMIGVPVHYAIGKLVDEIFQPWPHLIEKLHTLSEGRDEVSVGAGEAKRKYEVRLSTLKNSQGQFAGRIIMLRTSGGYEIPQPRYAAHGAKTQSITSFDQPHKQKQIPTRFEWLVNFITTPIKIDLQIPPQVNPKWYQARERSFTLILRLSAVLGTIALLIAPSFTTLEAGLPFAVIISLIWFLGLARNLNFQSRAAIFLILVYVMAFVEMYNFGFSVESFTFFMALVVSATLLMERKGGVTTLVISVATLGAFAIAIGGEYYLPVSAHEGIPVPANIQRGLTSTIVFAASAAAMLGSATILMESLNNAWRLESQALNLLQQERDLLEQRVNERTHDLLEAHDQAVIISKQMRKYYRAMEQSGATVVITDINGNIEYANPMFEQSTGYTLSEAIGKNPRILKSDTHPKEHYEDLWQVISVGNVWHGEFLNKRKDGSLYWESATIAPVMDSHGAVSNYVAIKEDITAKKELRDSLALAHGQALEASRLKSQLLSRVSHELRTPLGSVMGYAELIRSGAYGLVSDEQHDPLGHIIDSANYLTNLVNDLLDEAQIETRNLSLNINKFSLRAILQSVNDRMIVLAKNKGLNFDLEIKPAMPDQLFGDEKRVQQILVNLISNAIKFTNSGGVGIRVFQPMPTQWAAQVWDTGAGIPKESQEEIFIPFRQLNNSITRENRGTGLGLSIVKQIIEIMGGSIQLESEVGKGSKFTIVFPLVLPKEIVL